MLFFSAQLAARRLRRKDQKTPPVMVAVLSGPALNIRPGIYRAVIGLMFLAKVLHDR